MMKKLVGCLGVILLILVGTAPQSIAAEESVTLQGVGVCAKCALGQTDSCQNAIKINGADGEEVYLLTANDVSKAFHKNVCSGSADITAVGIFSEVGGKKYFTANKLSVRTDDLIKGEGLCLKCALGLTPSCQNAIRVTKGETQVLYVIAHDDVSKGFHKHVCQATVPVVASGRVSDVAAFPGLKNLTANKIDVVKEKAAAEPVAPKKVAEVKSATSEAAAKTVKIKGLGLCAKCELGETAECQNAVRLTKDGKEIVYLFAANEVSKAFHKNVCRSTANIVAEGSVSGEGDRSVFTPTSLVLQETKKLEGTALCLKCELGETRTCQNAIRVTVDGKDVLYKLDQNGVSKKFHRHVCQETVAVVAEGTVAELGDGPEFTAATISVK